MSANCNFNFINYIFYFRFPIFSINNKKNKQLNMILNELLDPSSITTATRPTITTNNFEAIHNTLLINSNENKNYVFYRKQQTSTEQQQIIKSLSLDETVASQQTSSSLFLNRVWCQTDQKDYCPLVITFMLFVIILSSLFILCLCYSKELLLKSSKSTNFMLKLFRKSHRQQQQQQLQLNNDDQTSRQSSSSDMINRNHHNQQQIWFTDMAIHVNKPPPTYEESQNHISNSITNFNFKRVFNNNKSYPRKSSSKRPPIVKSTINKNNVTEMNSTSSRQNEAYLQDVLDNEVNLRENSTVIFPEYKSLSLHNTQRGDVLIMMERVPNQNQNNNLLVRQQFNDSMPASASSSDLIMDNCDIPPAYETVINHQIPNESINQNNKFIEFANNFIKIV